MALTTVVFNDFSGGDSGRSRPDQDGRTFRGVNVWNYRSGLGPRPAFQDLRLTGFPTDPLSTLTFLRSTAFSANQLIVSYGTAIYRCNLTFGAAATNAGSVGAAPSNGLQIGSVVYFVSQAGAGSTIGASGAPANVAALPAGTLIAQVGELTVVATLVGGIQWSDLADPTVWPADNTLNIGAGTPIMNMLAQRNTLVLMMFEGVFWAITGVLGVNETLRQVDISDPLGISLPAVVNGSNLWYCVRHRMVKFSGAQALTVDRPDVPGTTGYTVSPWLTNPGHVLPLIDDDEFLLVGTLDADAAPTTGRTVWACAYRGGAWTRHIIPTPTTLTGAVSSQLVAVNVATMPVGYDGKVVIATMDDNGSKFYLFESQQEFPLMPTSVADTNNDGASAAPVVANVAFEQWHPEGGHVAVRSVLVDYSFDPTFTPSSTYNKFDLSVEALQNPGSASVRRSTVQTFTAPASGSTPDGSPLVRGQARFQMGDQGAGQGYRIRLDDWRGVIVHRISVQLDESPGTF